MCMALIFSACPKCAGYGLIHWADLDIDFLMAVHYPPEIDE